MFFAFSTEVISGLSSIFIKVLFETLLFVLAQLILIGGILFGTLISKGIFESNTEMCFPRAIVFFAASIFGSITAWAIIMQLLAISDRLKKLEGKD